MTIALQDFLQSLKKKNVSVSDLMHLHHYDLPSANKSCCTFCSFCAMFWCSAAVYIHGHGLEPFLLKAWVAAQDFQEGLSRLVQTCLALMMVNTKKALIQMMVGV